MPENIIQFPERHADTVAARALIYNHTLSDGTTVEQAMAYIADGQFTNKYDADQVARYYAELREIGILPFSGESSRLGVYGYVQRVDRLLAAIPALAAMDIVTGDFDLLRDGVVRVNPQPLD